MGIGILILPHAIMWGNAALQGDIARQEAEIEQRRIVRTTQTAQATLTPLATNGAETYTLTLPPRGGEDSVNASGTFFCLPVIYIILGISISWILLLLMPMVYPDVPEEPIESILNRFK